MGWIPWLGVLTPSQVDDVARDLALIDEDDVHDHLARDGGPVSAGGQGYVREYLRQAQQFTARMQQREWGLVYRIG